MMTDYKFWYIKRDDNGFITEAAIRFYEGQMVLERGKLVYKRVKRLQSQDLLHFTNKPFIKESTGNDCRLYTTSDFGSIKTDDELRLFLKGELLKDTFRTGIPEQVGEVLR